MHNRNQSSDANVNTNQIQNKSTKPEINKLLKDKKDYDPSLIRNMLMEQDLIRKLSKIIINLNEKQVISAGQHNLYKFDKGMDF